MSDPLARPPRPAFSIPSILAVIAAFCSFRVGAIGGFLLAVAAIALGVFGMLISIFPQKRGELVSAISIFAGVLGIVAALFKLIAGHW